jgi:catecholate siderophore receptor
MSSCKGRGAQRFVQSQFGFVSVAALLCLHAIGTKVAAQTSAQPTPAAQQSGQPAALPLPAVRVDPARRPAAKKAKQAPAKKAATRLPPAPPATVTPAINPNTSYNVSGSASPKMTAPLLNLPQTVTVVTPALIREQGARDLTEVLRTTPGITFDGGENGFGTSMTNFKLRGFDTSGNVFIDNSRDNGTYRRDMFNVESVEVFKGPAADNGRGGAGGYINIVSKVPVLQNFFAGEASVGWDEYNSEARRRATMDFNRMLSPTTAVRFNAVLEDSGVAGRELAESNPRGFAPSIAFGLGTEFRTVIAFEHQERNERPDWGVPAATIPGMLRFNPIAGNAPRDAFYGLRSDFDDTKADSARVKFEYDVHERGTISNQTRWSRVERTSRFTTIGNNPFGNPPNFTPPITVGTTTLFYDRTVETWTNQTNYISEFHTGQFKHNLSAGIDLSWEESDSGRFSGAVPPPGTTPLFDPNPDRVGAAPFDLTQTARVKVNTVAAYLYDTMHLNRHWQITGGFRVEHYKVHIDSRLVNGEPAGDADNVDITETTLNGKIGLVYKPLQNGSVYAAVGVSHQPPGSYLSNSDISRVGDDSAFPNFIPNADPVRAINYEIGTKWDFFNGRLSTTAALFHTEKRVPITGCVPNGAAPPAACAIGESIELKGYGEQIAQGIELGVAGSVTEHWKVFGGLLWMKTERKHSEALDAMRMAAQPGDYPAGFQKGTNGDELAFTPNFSATLWTTYLVPTTKWTVGGGAQYVSSSWIGRPDDAERMIPNGVFGKLPSYFVVHAMTSYEVYKDVHVRFNVDNIADRKYAVSSNWPGQRVMLGAPRTYRLSTSFRF